MQKCQVLGVIMNGLLHSNNEIFLYLDIGKLFIKFHPIFCHNQYVAWDFKDHFGVIWVKTIYKLKNQAQYWNMAD